MIEERYPYFTLLDGTRRGQGQAIAIDIFNHKKLGEVVMVKSPERRVIVRRIGVEIEPWDPSVDWKGLDKL